MKASKWNYKSKSYDEYELPMGAKAYCSNLDENVSCANCGAQIKYDDGFTSLEIHTPSGFGYIVCPDCYLCEWERRNKARDTK